MKSELRHSASIKLTAGNIRNHHLYVRGLETVIPPGTIGGPNERSIADNKITVMFLPGLTVETDIAGDKMILRNRTAVRDYFAHIGAKSGDRIIIEYDGTSSWRVFKAPD